MSGGRRPQSSEGPHTEVGPAPRFLRRNPRLADFTARAGKDLDLHTWYDQAELILASARSVQHSILIGIGLAVLVLRLFQRVRPVNGRTLASPPWWPTRSFALVRRVKAEWYARGVSPTVLRVGSLRFYFFSREEPRLHIHVQGPRGEAKFWLEPEVCLAEDHGLGARNLAIATRAIREHEEEIHAAWRAHFGG